MKMTRGCIAKGFLKTCCVVILCAMMCQVLTAFRRCPSTRALGKWTTEELLRKKAKAKYESLKGADDCSDTKGKKRYKVTGNKNGEKKVKSA
jgi:hypothetical protein